MRRFRGPPKTGAPNDARGADSHAFATVTNFVLSGLLALLLVAVGGAIVLRNLGTSEAIREATQVTRALGLVIQPHLTERLAQGSPDAIESLDKVVDNALDEELVTRVKVWSKDGTVVYSDEDDLIGRSFDLEDEELETLRAGRGAKAEVSDLERPENAYEVGEEKLLEVYLPMTGRNDDPFLFEAYLPFSSVTAGGQRIWLDFAPVLIIPLLVLWLVQVPIASSLVRRLKDRLKERERLLRRAIEASDAERRRIASDLHDGIVQDLAGLSFELSATAGLAMTQPRSEVQQLLNTAAADTRQTMRQLRTLLVDIHPPNLHTEGLEAALNDLATPLTRSGIEVVFDLPDRLHPSPEVEALIFRGAQEALRNVHAYAEASRVVVRVAANAHSIVLTVEDDGRGFTPSEVERRMAEGHFGLRLLSELTSDAGGMLDVQSRPGRGTQLRMEVPAA